MSSFFTDFATGFLGAAGEEMSQQRRYQQEMDMIRQKRVMDHQYDRDLLEYKSRLDQQKQQELEANLTDGFSKDFGIRVSQQTAQALDPMQPSAVSNTRVMPAGVSMDEEEVDDNDYPFGDVEETTQSVTLEPMSAQIQTTPNPTPKQYPAQVIEEARNAYIVAGKKGGRAAAQIAAQKVYNSYDANDPEVSASRDVAKKQAMVTSLIDQGAAADEATARRMVYGKAADTDSSVDPSIIAQEIEDLGLPALPKARITNKANEKALGNFDDAVWASKDARDAINANSRVINLAKQFMTLNRRNPTGGPLMALPFVKEIKATINADFAGMESATSELVMSKIKALGSGSAISNSDREFTEKAGLSTLKLGEANEAQAAAMIAAAQVDNEYRKFVEANRTTQDANPAAIEKVWNEYSNANPVFAPGSTVGKIIINEERLSPAEYFKAVKNGTLDEAREEARARFTTEPGMPGALNASKPASADTRPPLTSFMKKK